MKLFKQGSFVASTDPTTNTDLITQPVHRNASTARTLELIIEALSIFAVLLIGSIEAILIAIALPDFWNAKFVRLALEFVDRTSSRRTAFLVVSRWAIDLVVASERIQTNKLTANPRQVQLTVSFHQCNTKSSSRSSRTGTAMELGNRKFRSSIRLFHRRTVELHRRSALAADKLRSSSDQCRTGTLLACRRTANTFPTRLLRTRSLVDRRTSSRTECISSSSCRDIEHLCSWRRKSSNLCPSRSRSDKRK